MCCCNTAFEDAAALVLEGHTKPKTPKLCAIIAYYPSAIPPPSTKFPNSIRVLVHLAGNEIGVRRTPEVLGIQSSKKKTVRKRVDPGAGYGGCLQLGFKAYTYDAEPGFAEHDLDEYDAVNEQLAFSRSLGVVKRAFRIDEQLDVVRDQFTDDVRKGAVEKVMQKTMPFAHVISAPTLIGGAGQKALQHYYQNLLKPLPSGGTTQLLSRTVSADRVVDELFLSFTHSAEMPWLLPSIPPTNKKVEIAVVSIVRLCGGRLESEHLYWDQASVLLQLGLLDPKLAMPEAMQKKGVKRLPVVGAEAARAIRRGSSREMNGFVDGTK